ncbi:MAG: hypothetical protein JHC61_06330 [Burkholderiaceae bacterium]|nr:hypothetical protein [Burkholderiaceae bacterium]
MLQHSGYAHALSAILLAEPIPHADVALVQRAAVSLDPAAQALPAMVTSYVRMTGAGTT